MSFIALHHTSFSPKRAAEYWAHDSLLHYRLKTFWHAYKAFVIAAAGIVLLPLTLYGILQLMIYPAVADAKLEDMIEIYANYSLTARDIGKSIPVVNPSSGQHGTVTFAWNIYSPSCVDATIEGAHYSRYGIDNIDRLPKSICNTRFDHLPRK